MLRNKYSPALATGTIAASGTLGQIIPPSIVLIILADQLIAADLSSIRKSLYKEATGELSMPSVMDVTSTSAGEMFRTLFRSCFGVVIHVIYSCWLYFFHVWPLLFHIMEEWMLPSGLGGFYFNTAYTYRLSADLSLLE